MATFGSQLLDFLRIITGTVDRVLFASSERKIFVVLFSESFRRRNARINLPVIDCFLFFRSGYVLFR